MAALIEITIAAPGTSSIYPVDGNMSSPSYTVHVTSLTGGGSLAIQGSVERYNPTADPSNFAALDGMSAITAAGIYTFNAPLRFLRAVLTGAGSTAAVKVLTGGIGS